MTEATPPPNVELRDVVEDDLPILYRHQLDPVATQMADFPSRDWPAFIAHWTKLLGDDTLITKAIVCDGVVVGNIGSWEQTGHREVGYWIDRDHWGRGIATEALRQLVAVLPDRPLYAYVAAHNAASIRVLEKCGFRRVSTDELSGPADAGDSGEGFMLVLD